jgi:hypothetical protein
MSQAAPDSNLASENVTYVYHSPDPPHGFLREGEQGRRQRLLQSSSREPGLCTLWHRHRPARPDHRAPGPASRDPLLQVCRQRSARVHSGVVEHVRGVAAAGYPFADDTVFGPAGSAALDGGAAGAAEFADAHVADAPGTFDDSEDDASLYCYPPNCGPAAIPTAEGAHEAQISAESRAHADVDCGPTATATGDGIAADEDWAGVAGISRFEQSMHLWSLSYD